MIAAGLSLYLDRLFGEVDQRVHPVALFGRVMQKFERYGWRDTKGAGVQFSLFGLGLGYLGSVVLGGGFIGSLASSYLAVAERSLLSHAAQVAELLANDDVVEARKILPTLVGRDVSRLDSGQCSRAVIESVAENSSDAVIAPMFYAGLFGSVGVLLYRAINTMDAMVGYRSRIYRNFGWASAKLDDAANWVPSRISALMATMASPRATEINSIQGLSKIIADAKTHPSPNAGVVEAAFAHTLGIKLGGTNHYLGIVEERSEMGVGGLPSVQDVFRSVELCKRIDEYFSICLVGVGAALLISDRRKK